ncbi:MAG: hypothetical protein FRX49_01669 [Trebouxia sp. A1-2]|nr:MAG: hypothetical protein FRX49_01669 [Trebouxia sp. A1-2]
MRDVFPGSQRSNHEGYIKHEAVQLDAGQSKDSDSYRQASTEPKEARPCNSSDLTPAPNVVPASELVRLEAQRVQAKFVSNVDTGTEVILRFDFMTSYDTRVAMFVVHAAHFAGFIILLVQFINIMTQFFLLFLVHAYSGQVVDKHSKPKPKMIMDGPWHWLWPCLIPWIILQIPTSIGWLHTIAHGAADNTINAIQRGVVLSNCTPDVMTRVCIDTMVGIACIYFAVTCVLLMLKLSAHRKVAYRRIQLRLRLEVMLFFSLCLVLLWLVRQNSCGSTEFVALGIMPMQVVMTANAFVWSFISMPHTPQDDAAAKRIWEQEFAWTEGDKPIKLAARALTVPKGSSLNHQPMFCFHTMMKMWYWSCLVYDYQRAVKKRERKRSNGLSPEKKADASQMAQPTQKTSLQLQRAVDMCGLTGSELFCEVRRDTRCLMGWSNSTIVLAFRGTASMTNALSDLQAWRVAHPPVRGHLIFFSRPLVHVGFLQSWLAGGFNTKVIKRIMEMVDRRQPGSDKLKIIITGHSLGGALATLAAYDICKQLQASNKQDVEVMCYSFGAPRTGNHAFAADYNRVVPDTWSDVVTRGGKFFFLYKRPGQSMDKHLLSSYQYAIMAVILAQFTCKGFSDGMEGVALLENQMGMRFTEMQCLSQLSPEEREGQTLTGAHLPTRGFYKIKSEAKIQKQASRQLTWCGIPLWWRVPLPVPDSSVSDLHHVSADTELAEAASGDQPVVIEVKSEELLGAEPAAAESQGTLRDG